MELSVKLEVFEGPLDLLLHLIDKNKVNIYDIPIVEITAQYMEYIREMQRQDLNIMSEFLVMAATLLNIKAKMLLPASADEDGEEEDPRAELVEKLLEYKMYKYMSLELKDRMVDAERSMYRKPALPKEVQDYEEPIDMDELLGDLTLTKLGAVFKSLMKRQEDKIDPVRSKFVKVEKEEVSMTEKISYVERYARERGCFSFQTLMLSQKTKMHRIVAFLAVLELVKGGKLHVFQTDNFGDITIEAALEGTKDPALGMEEKKQKESDGSETDWR